MTAELRWILHGYDALVTQPQFGSRLSSRLDGAFHPAAKSLDFHFAAQNRRPHVLVMNYSGLEEEKVEEAVSRLCRAVLG